MSTTVVDWILEALDASFRGIVWNVNSCYSKYCYAFLCSCVRFSLSKYWEWKSETCCLNHPLSCKIWNIKRSGVSIHWNALRSVFSDHVHVHRTFNLCLASCFFFAATRSTYKFDHACLLIGSLLNPPPFEINHISAPLLVVLGSGFASFSGFAFFALLKLFLTYL